MKHTILCMTGPGNLSKCPENKDRYCKKVCLSCSTGLYCSVSVSRFASCRLLIAGRCLGDAA